MIANPSYWSSEACAARAARFGRFMVVWRKRCSWSQYDLPKWGKAAGFIAPAIGTMSQLERGQVATPTMALFAALEEANRRLMVKDYSEVVDARLRDRLKQGVPVLDRTGEPWAFHEFVSAFHLPDQVNGEIWEASATGDDPGPELTVGELDRVNQALVEGFRSLVREVKPSSKALRMASMVAPPAERPAYEDALIGLGYDADTLQRLWNSEAGEWAPLVWWATLQHQQNAESGGGDSHLQ